MKRKLDEDDAASTSKRAASSSVKSSSSTQAATTRMSLAEFLQAKTLPRLGPFPASDATSREKFFVRDCYPRFYDSIMKLFNDSTSSTQGITVTGTQGIGKKSFMAYFFQRYRLENPHSNIHLETRKANLTLKMLCIWEGEKSTLTFSKNRQVDVDELCTMRGQDGSLRLIAGCPEDVPHCRRWICFTNPNAEWEAELLRSRTHRRFVMPLWNPSELRDAALALGMDVLLKAASDEDEHEHGAALHAQLPMNQDVIGFRYCTFGGVARACLEMDREALDTEYHRGRMASELLHQSMKIDQMNISFVEKVTQSICHYVPHATDLAGTPSYEAGSPFIKQVFLHSFIDDCVIHDLPDVLLPVEWIEAMFFGARVHQTLQKGTTITAESFPLDPQEERKSWSYQLIPSPSIHVFTSTSKHRHLKHGPFYTPFINTQTSIDGLYVVTKASQCGDYPEQRPSVILFQIANIYRPVPCDGVLQVLTNLNLWEDVQRSPADCVAIVHVVPVKHATKFQRAPFEVCEDLSGDSNVSHIQGIGRVAVKMLCDDHGIATVQQLDAFDGTDSAVVGMAKRLLEAHKERVKTSGAHIAEVLETIPQFVWGM